MNPAILCAISAVALRQSNDSGDAFFYQSSSRSKEPWLKRRRRTRLLKQLRRDAQLKAMRRPIDEARNERLWNEYFALG